MARRPARPRRAPRFRTRRTTSLRRLTALLGLALLAHLGAVALERTGRLPEPVVGLVREAEAGLLTPLLAELGVDWPGGDGAEPRFAQHCLAVAGALGHSQRPPEGDGRFWESTAR